MNAILAMILKKLGLAALEIGSEAAKKKLADKEPKADPPDTGKK